jgi:hypothetical protein
VDKFHLPRGLQLPKDAAGFPEFLEKVGKTVPRTAEVVSAIFHRKGANDEAMAYANLVAGFASLLSLASTQMQGCDDKSCSVHLPWHYVGQLGAAIAVLCHTDQQDIESLCRARFEDAFDRPT